MEQLKEPPKKFEDLTRLVHERHETMSKSHQKIALYLIQNPNDVALKSLNAMAKESGAHASGFVRFSQSLGFAGFKELQQLFQTRLTTAAPGFEARQQVLAKELSAVGAQNPGNFLGQLVARDLESLSELTELTRQSDLEEAARLLNSAEAVYLVGQLRSAPVAELLRYILTMLGKKTILLNTSGGLNTHMVKTIGKNDLLFAISFRFYANEVVRVVEDAGQQDVPVIGISDSTLSPIAKHSSPLFVIPERQYTFSRSLAAPVCLAQAIMLHLAALQQDQPNPRIPTVTSE